MAYATYEDVADRSFEDVSEYEALIERRLNDAELLIKVKVPNLDMKVASGELDPDVVAYVEAEMVLRLVRNPEGYVQESDGNYSYMLSQSIASGKLEVGSEEWRMLGVRQGAFVIRPYLEIP